MSEEIGGELDAEHHSQPQASLQPQADSQADRESTGSLIDTLLYGMSIPERTVRSTSAIVGGIVGESAARLIPAAFRSSKSYDVFIQQALDVMIHDVGGVAKPGVAKSGDGSNGHSTSTPEQTTDATKADAAQESQLARKAIGSLLDVAGGATLHLSPMTVLAVFNDVAYGSSVYLNKLTAELKREGVIDESSTIHHAADLIEAMRSSSTRASGALEAPPISIDAMQQTIAEIRQEVAKVDPRTLLPQGEIERMWLEMESAATASDASLWDVSATMTMFAMNRVTLTTRGALSSVRVAGNLLDEHLVQHYFDALSEIREQGLYETLSNASAPYVEAVWQNFEAERETWTVEILTGRVFGKAWSQVREWWSSDGEEPKN
ncbi:hypothetical protein Pla22_32210 [Rubripirellula amarantea]|uniref:Uncharacterized protein n=1 Tax=Rubripirellula amarantea TaxID=2527999 RepID=A0A5C5WIB8_9BACT|nr:hypothetical protein [Rubripirellula amarantea]TWT50478.1 hypothetical protein Pla22_32210 [Rubripirellula amarantea]